MIYVKVFPHPLLWRTVFVNFHCILQSLYAAYRNTWSNHKNTLSAESICEHQNCLSSVVSLLRILSSVCC